MSLPTFGIVTFMRPAKCARLVESIRRRYPVARIVIADNGRKLPATAGELAAAVPGATTYVLPFDCGLSASRNFLISKTQGDLVILDDDFEFDESTEIEALQQVLAENPEIGIACGNASFVKPQDFTDEGVSPAAAPLESTTTGVPFQRCELADNFMLVRRAVFDDGIRWNPGLKVGEHRPFFETVAKSRWQVAHVPDVMVRHDRTGNTQEYNRHRCRGPQLQKCLRDGTKPPSIVVLAVGHTGTRYVVRAAEALGWNLGQVKEGVAEHLGVQAINKRILLRSGICECGSDRLSEQVDFPGNVHCARCDKVRPLPTPPERHEFHNVLKELPQPWVIKDPRLVLTWEQWLPAIGRYKPLVILLERDLARMRQTYAKHGFEDFCIYGRDVPELVEMARWHFASYQGPKWKVQYEQIAAACRRFDPSKAT